MSHLAVSNLTEMKKTVKVNSFKFKDGRDPESCLLPLINWLSWTPLRKLNELLYKVYIDCLDTWTFQETFLDFLQTLSWIFSRKYLVFLSENSFDISKSLYFFKRFSWSLFNRISWTSRSKFLRLVQKTILTSSIFFPELLQETFLDLFMRLLWTSSRNFLELK